MPEEYLVPFGIDSASFVKGISQMESSVDDFNKTVATTGDNLKKSFDESARSNEQLRQSVLSNVQAAKEFRNEIANGITPDLKKFNAVNDALQANLETLRQKIVRTSDPALLETYRRQLGLLDTQVKNLGDSFKNFQPLDVNTKGITESIGLIKNLEAELQRLETYKRNATDPKDIERFNKAIISARVELKSYSNLGLDAAHSSTKLAGGADAANQALTNTGRVLQDLPFGFIGIQNNLNPLLESFQRLKAETGSSGSALKALGSSLIGAGGVGLALSAVTAILSFASIGFQAWESHVKSSKKAVDDAKKSDDEYMQSLEDVRKALLQGQIDAQKELITLENLYRATQNLALSTNERKAAADEILKKYPDYLQGLTNEDILAGKAAVAYNNLKDAIIASARARAASTILEKEQEKKLINEQQIADAESEKLKQQQRLKDAQLLQKQLAATGTLGLTPQANKEVETSLRGIEDAQKKINDKKAENLKIDEASLKLQQQIDLQQKKGGTLAITGSGNFVTEQAKKDAAEAEKARKKKESEDKKSLASGKKADSAEEAQQKAFNALMERLIEERRQFGAKAIEDNLISELAAADVSLENYKTKTRLEVKEAKVSNSERKKLQAEADLSINAAMAANEAAKEDIREKYKRRQEALENAGQKALNSIQQTKQDQDIAAINARYQATAEAIEKGGMLTIEVQASIERARQNEIDSVNIKYGSDQIKKQTDLAVAGIKVSENYAGKSAAIEKAKQIAILEEQLKGAKAQLALLETNGKDQNDLEVRNAQQVVKNFESAIAGAQSNKGKGQTIFEALGIGANSEKLIDEYAKAASTAGQITSDFLGALSDLEQQAIDKKKERVDQDNKELDDLETRLDKEKELRDAGRANDVDGLQKLYDSKKAQRDEDLRQQQELQKKQNALKKAQLIADSISQVSNLITAASEIFSAFAAIPFVGVPLAIAAIGVMFGSFALAKVKAFQSIESEQSFGEGGWVNGKPHSQGGKKYRSIDGGGGVVELEGEEHVTKKSQAKKFAPLLDAINSDHISTMDEDSLRKMMSGLGISMHTEAPKQAVKIVRVRDSYKQQTSIYEANRPDISKDVKGIRENVSFLADKERFAEKRWEDEDFQYIKRGNSTTRIKKKR